MSDRARVLGAVAGCLLFGATIGAAVLTATYLTARRMIGGHLTWTMA